MAPFTVSVKAGPPAGDETGFRLDKVGERIANGDVFDVAPPGFTTVTPAVPGVVTRLAVTDAVSCVSLTKTVLNAVPLNCTVEPLMKLVPFTVSVNAGLPAVAETGLRPEIVGERIGNVAVFDVAPPGFTTVTPAFPGAVSRSAVTDAVSCVTLTKAVLNGVPLNCTAEPETKLVPSRVSVNAGLPATAENGLKSEIVWALATPAASKATALSGSSPKRDLKKRDTMAGNMYSAVPLPLF